MKSCKNCKNRYYIGWDGMIDSCIWYCIAEGDGEVAMVREAGGCGKYEEGTPECFEEDYYCPSSTAGDYSPGNPWDAPGMSIRDFI